MFAPKSVVDYALLSANQRRRIFDNESTRQFASAKNELPSHAIGFPPFLLNHSYLLKTANSDRLLDRKSYATIPQTDDHISHKLDMSKTKWEPFETTEDVGPSSLRVFTGEDPMKKDREGMMKDMQRRWLEMQMAEKALKESKQRYQQYSMAKSFADQLKIARSQEKQDEQYSRNLNKAVEKYNKQLSLHKMQLKAARSYREESFKNIEKNNHIESNMLHERKDSTNSDNHIFIPHHWDEIVCQTEAKIHKEEKDRLFQQKDVLEKQELKYWDKRNLMANKSQLIDERQHRRWSREQNKQLMIENMRLSEEQKILQSKVYKCLTEDDFYEQFGKTRR